MTRRSEGVHVPPPEDGRDEAGFGPVFGEAAGSRGRGPLILAVSAGVALVFSAVVWTAYNQGERIGGRDAPPRIPGAEGPLKVHEAERPVTTPDLDKRVYDLVEGVREPAPGVDQDEAGAPNPPRSNTADRDVSPADEGTEIGAETQVETRAQGGGINPPAALRRGDGTSLQDDRTSAPGEGAGDLPANTDAAPPPIPLPGDADVPEKPASPDDAPAPVDLAEIDGPPPPTPRLKPARATVAEEPETVTRPDTRAREPSPTPAPAPASSEGAYAVQVASFRERTAAETAWEVLRSRHPELLQGRMRDIAMADLGERGTRHRLRVAAFVERAEAQQFCDVLQARGQECLVVRR